MRPQMLSEPAPAALRLIEGRSAASVPVPVPNPVPDLDHDFSRTLAAIGGEAARARIHALHPARPGDEAAATGFAFTLFSHLAAIGARSNLCARPPRPILWIQHQGARREAGRPYGLGFARFGLDPAQFVIITTKTALDALAATEIGLETGGLDGVLAELPPNLPADMLALGKRLALRAERSATPCLLLHASAAAVPAPVATRWQIASRPAVPDAAGLQTMWRELLPAADLTLVKNRFGPTGRWSAPLTHASSSSGDTSGVAHVRVPSSRTGISAPLSQPVDALSPHRPHPPPARSHARPEAA